MHMWVACQLLNSSFIFNRTEYAKLGFYLCFYEFNLYASHRFWTLFSPKNTLRLICELIYMRVYTVLDLHKLSINWVLLQFSWRQLEDIQRLMAGIESKILSTKEKPYSHGSEQGPGHHSAY